MTVCVYVLGYVIYWIYKKNNGGRDSVLVENHTNYHPVVLLAFNFLYTLPR